MPQCGNLTIFVKPKLENLRPQKLPFQHIWRLLILIFKNFYTFWRTSRKIQVTEKCWNFHNGLYLPLSCFHSQPRWAMLTPTNFLSFSTFSKSGSEMGGLTTCLNSWAVSNTHCHRLRDTLCIDTILLANIFAVEDKWRSENDERRHYKSWIKAFCQCGYLTIFLPLRILREININVSKVLDSAMGYN